MRLAYNNTLPLPPQLLPQRITIIGDIVSKTSDMEGFGISTFLNGFGGLISQAIAGNKPKFPYHSMKC